MHNILATLSQRSLNDKLLLVLIWS